MADSSDAGETDGNGEISIDFDIEAAQRVRPIDLGLDPSPSSSEEASPATEPAGRGLEAHRDGTQHGGHDDREDGPPALTPTDVEEAAEWQQTLVAAAQLLLGRNEWQAPLPSPEVLRRYDEILPGAAERILRMAEKSVSGLIDIEAPLAEAEIKGADQGRWMAFGITISAMAASVIFFATGDDLAGLTFLSVPVVMLVRSVVSSIVRRDRGPGTDLAPSEVGQPELGEG